MEKGHRPVGEQAIELMAIPMDARVLDVGCGSGWATRLMAEKASGGHVVGIDIADEMIDIARDTSTSFANVDFRVASAEALPFPDASFTHAFSMESLYYYADLLVALKEIRRVLNPGGPFVTVVDLYQENEPSGQWIADFVRNTRSDTPDTRHDFCRGELALHLFETRRNLCAIRCKVAAPEHSKRTRDGRENGHYG